MSSTGVDRCRHLRGPGSLVQGHRDPLHGLRQGAGLAGEGEHVADAGPQRLLQELGGELVDDQDAGHQRVLPHDPLAQGEGRPRCCTTVP